MLTFYPLPNFQRTLSTCKSMYKYKNIFLNKTNLFNIILLYIENQRVAEPQNTPKIYFFMSIIFIIYPIGRVSIGCLYPTIYILIYYIN